MTDRRAAGPPAKEATRRLSEARAGRLRARARERQPGGREARRRCWFQLSRSGHASSSPTPMTTKH